MVQSYKKKRHGVFFFSTDAFLPRRKVGSLSVVGPWLLQGRSVVAPAADGGSLAPGRCAGGGRGMAGNGYLCLLMVTYAYTRERFGPPGEKRRILQGMETSKHTGYGKIRFYVDGVPPREGGWTGLLCAEREPGGAHLGGGPQSAHGGAAAGTRGVRNAVASGGLSEA